jgi:iron complex outermembrane receptor protein
VALGAEYRNGNYSITQGEWASYIYGGAQSYPGFAPTDAGSYGRNSWAGYVDVAFDPIKNWHIDLAGRYETYSDFGGVWIGKANGRYDFNDKIAIRGTVSNGFRAPTLADPIIPRSTLARVPPSASCRRTRLLRS